MIMSETKTISLDGSETLMWEDVDKYAHEKGFKTTSGFIQYLLEKDMFGIKYKVKDIITYVMFLTIIAMISLMLIITINR